MTRRRAVDALALLVLAAGATFALQGLRVLPSRVMYGEPTWVVIGGVMMVGSLAFLWARRR